MSRLNVKNNHMIMPVNRDTAEYEEVQYYCSVHSEDRNVFKYPDSGSFEIEFPRDYLNVKTMTISEMAMPINNELFSTLFNNVFLLFKINEPYNPVETSGSTADILQYTIFQALNARKEQDFIIQIENGYFSVDQMITELTRRMNDAVTEYITNYLSEFAPDLSSSLTTNLYWLTTMSTDICGLAIVVLALFSRTPRLFSNNKNWSWILNVRIDLNKKSM